MQSGRRRREVEVDFRRLMMEDKKLEVNHLNRSCRKVVVTIHVEREKQKRG